MIRYVAMIEHKVCTQPKPCMWMYDCKHKKGKRWVPDRVLFSKIGPCRASINAARRAGNTEETTGEAYMMITETDGFVRIPDEAVMTVETLQSKYETLERMMESVNAALVLAKVAAENAPPEPAVKPKKPRKRKAT